MDIRECDWRVADQIREIGSEALIVPTDVSKQENCMNLAQKTLDHWGHTDVLVNNAGYGHYASIENLETQDLEKIFKTNLFGSFWCTKAFLPHMKKRKAGHIVHVSTVISKRSMPFMTAYCMTKFAMNALYEGLRLELRPYGICASLVCPGLTATDFQMNAGKEGYSPPIQSQGGMSAKKVGKIILKAVEQNKRRVSLTFSGRILLAFQRVSPFLVDEILHLVFSKTPKSRAINVKLL